MMLLRRLLAGLVAGAILISACGCSTSAQPPVQPEDPYSPSQMSFGSTPIPGQGATFQPDVVVIAAGAAAVESVSDDGLTWMLDPNAPGVGDLAPGKVLFVTSRGVGRIVDASRSGADLAVTLAPVTITDVIKDGSFASTSAISLDKAIVYQTPQPFWADPQGASEDGAPRIGPASYRPGVDLPTVPGIGTDAATVAGGFGVTSTCCESGVGAAFSYGAGGIKIEGSIALEMSQPHASFALNIAGGEVTNASFHLLGAAGLKLAVAAGTSPDGFTNINRALPVSAEFTVPVATILGVPLSVTVNQYLNVQTTFSAKTAYISANGEYSFSGDLGFDYSNKTFTPSFVSDPQVKTSILDSAKILSVGVNGIAFDDHVKFTIGLGAYGFKAGVYFTLTATLGLTLGSALATGSIVCRGAQLDLWGDYGVGYDIPKPVTALINFFLKHFNSTPIASSGGIAGPAKNFFDRAVVEPDSKICKK
ncbi:hypothetical protein KPL76_08740 [Subtercola sp. PAMC28395]|uniref:hypothetical protein n=1 Tax=Subtercola sp. PAMC28395 TaxID=2846775 RepID=UPI001C0D0B8E|nr:hypothetical protein [Subtercola sp. PAMC28395]QWT22883.1 hypothetical protein KPL76_08740 [Subtercola sp. PAMC28395]